MLRSQQEGKATELYANAINLFPTSTSRNKTKPTSLETIHQGSKTALPLKNLR